MNLKIKKFSAGVLTLMVLLTGSSFASGGRANYYSRYGYGLRNEYRLGHRYGYGLNNRYGSQYRFNTYPKYRFHSQPFLRFRFGNDRFFYGRSYPFNSYHYRLRPYRYYNQYPYRFSPHMGLYGYQPYYHYYR
jgi:hypothetical protein